MKLGEHLQSRLNRLMGKPYFVIEDGKKFTVAVVGKHHIPIDSVLSTGDIVTDQNARHLPIVGGGSYPTIGHQLEPGQVVKFIPYSDEAQAQEAWREVAKSEGVSL